MSQEAQIVKMVRNSQLLAALQRSPRSRQLGLYGAYLVVFFLLILGILSSAWLWQVKDFGVEMDSAGQVVAVDPDSHAAFSGLTPGDKFQRSDYRLISQLTGEAAEGQVITLPVMHAGQQHTVSLEARASSLSRRIDFSIITWVGMGFVLLGLAPLIARRRQFVVWMLFISQEVAGLFLITEGPRPLHLAWAELIASVTLPLFPAFAFHFHSVFPRLALGRRRRGILITVYLIGLVLVALNIYSLFDPRIDENPVARTALRLYVVGCLAGCLGMLIVSYRIHEKRVRAQLKIITVCVGSGLVINVFLLGLATVLNLSLRRPLENVAVTSALITPIGYAYSMIRYNVLIDGILWRRWLIRAVISSILFIIGAGWGLVMLGGTPINASTAIDIGVLATLGAVVVGALNVIIGEWAETRLLHGATHVDLLDHATRELQRFTRLEEYVDFFAEELPDRLKIRGALVFLAESQAQKLTLKGFSQSLTPIDPTTELVATGEVYQIVQNARGLITVSTLFMGGTGSRSQADQRLIETLQAAKIELLMALVTSQPGQLIGLVALGNKETDEGYSPQEMAALSALSRTAATSAENVLLFEQQQKQLAELIEEREYRVHLARYANAAQEDARKRIARDLHDRPLQDLASLQRALAEMRVQIQTMLVDCQERIMDLEAGAGTVDPNTRAEILAILTEEEKRLGRLLGEDLSFYGAQAENGTLPLESCPNVEGMIEHLDATSALVREVCNDLHPTYLVSPLTATLKTSVVRLQKQNPKMIMEFISTGREPAQVADDIKVTCKHIVEQAIHNATKHGQPSRIDVRLDFTDGNQLVLTVADNGKGFVTPGMRELRANGHHGLPNMQERAEIVGGSLDLSSNPGQGTQVKVTLPTQRTEASSSTFPTLALSSDRTLLIPRRQNQALPDPIPLP